MTDVQAENPGASPGPHLVSALLCEKILDEKDSVKSLIRIIDRVLATGSGSEAPEKMPTIEFRAVLFVSFKSGNAQGPVPIKITLTKPSGIEEPQPLYDGTIHFDGGTRGNNLISNIQLRITEAGPYWFNVYVDAKFVTRTPLEVIWTIHRAMGTAAP